MWIWPFRCVDSVVFVSCTKFGSNICISQSLRSMHRCLRLSFEINHQQIVTRINFRFRLSVTWSFPHGHDAFLMQNIFIKSGVIDIFFRNSRWRRVDSVVYVFCTELGSNIYYSHWDRRTYASDLGLMTSRELTSNYDFWSAGHLRMAVVHLSI